MPSFINSRGLQITAEKIFVEHENRASELLQELDAKRRGKTDDKNRQAIPGTELLFEQGMAERVAKGSKISIKIEAKISGSTPEGQQPVSASIIPILTRTHVARVEYEQPVQEVIGLGVFRGVAPRPTHAIERVGDRRIEMVKFAVGRLLPTEGLAQPGQTLVPASRVVELAEQTDQDRIIETANLIAHGLDVLEWMGEGASYQEALAEAASSYAPNYSVANQPL